MKITSRALGYIRVSGQSQLDGDGPKRQEAAIAGFAPKNGLAIAKTFIDGISGEKDGFDRPAWTEMMQYALDSSINTVIIERLDRLARDLGVQEYIIRDLRKRGITLISVAEPDLCSEDPSRELLRQLLACIAAYDRKMIGLKCNAAKTRLRAAGKKTDGTYPYGKHPKKPHEVEVLAWMLECKRRGANASEIARQLNAVGRPARRGGVWISSVVQRILSENIDPGWKTPKRLPQIAA